MTLVKYLSDFGFSLGFSEEPFEALAHQAANILKCALDTEEIDTLIEPNKETPSSYLSHNKPAHWLPLHTDYPDRFPPPRYILLRCEQAGKCPVTTLLVDVMHPVSKPPRIDIIKNEPWIITSGPSRGRTIKILSCDSRSGKPLLRYAENVMRPLFSNGAIAAAVLKDLCSRSPSYEEILTPGAFVIIDNWRMLHGRSASQNNQGNWISGNGRVIRRALLF